MAFDWGALGYIIAALVALWIGVRMFKTANERC